MENNLVIKANKLNESRYKLTVVEQRIILTMISLIDPKDKDFKPYSFTIKEFEKLTGVTGGNTYSRIKRITKSLRDTGFTITESTGDLQLGWVSSVKYYDNEGKLELTFDPHLKPYLLALKKEFTRYQLKNTVKLRSAYSVRIYELLKQYQSIENRSFLLEDLRTILCLSPDKLQPYGNFKRKVLDVAAAELKENSDIYFDYKPIKSGRKVVSIEFYIKKNADFIKTSFKNKKNPTCSIDKVKEEQLELELKNNSISLLNKRFDDLATRYPNMYQKLKKSALKTLTKKEKRNPGMSLTVKFKMKGMLNDFVKNENLDV